MGIYDELSQLDSEARNSYDVGSSSTVRKSAATDKERKASVKQNRGKESKLTSHHDYLKSFLQHKATTASTFRLSPSLIDQLEDIQYKMKKKTKIRMSKYQMVTIALAELFWKIEEEGGETWIYDFLEDWKNN